MPPELPALLLCPFCGGKAVLEQMGWPHHVYCTNCGAKVTSLELDWLGDRQAIAKWNQRIEKEPAAQER